MSPPDISTETPARKTTPWWIWITIGRSPRRTLIRLSVLVLITFVTFKFFVALIHVEGVSMAPTYRDGEIRFVNKLAYLRSKPQRGDVVAIKLAGGRVLLLKRIIGLPGDRVSIVRRAVFINGQPLAEPYLKLKPIPWLVPEFTVKDHHYFVIGDNRSMNQRDHEFGSYPEDRILGRVGR